MRSSRTSWPDRLRPLGVAICVVVAGGCIGGWGYQPVEAEREPETPTVNETTANAEAGPAGAPGDQTSSPTEELQEIMLLLRDGTRLTAMLVHDEPDAGAEPSIGGPPGGVTVRIGGVTTTFRHDQVERYEILPPVMERYLTLRQAVGNDPDQILQLAEWLRVRERYELAYAEVERALTVAPGHVEARRLKTLIGGQIMLREKSRTRDEDARRQREEDGAAAGERGKVRRLDFPLLTTPQINLIKVYEVDLTDKTRVLIQRETVLRMLQKYAGNPLVPVTEEGREAIARKPAKEVLELMFRLQARDFYGEVEVLDHSPGIVAFRDHVQRTWLLNSCATTMCHGGEQAGRLWLYNRRPNSDEALYTNFLILDRFKLKDGTPLLNYEAPERSPLLQMGLPREDSLYPHPVVMRGSGSTARDAWKRAFRSTDERQFERSAAWLKQMYSPRPEYPITYAPPSPSAVPAQPAVLPPTAPSSTPPSTPQPRPVSTPPPAPEEPARGER